MNTPEPMKVVICDDDPRRSERWGEEVRRRGGFDVIPLSGQQLADQIRLLNERRSAARRTGDAELDDTSPLDEADVLILDYDLTPDPSTQGDLEAGSFDDVLTTLRNQSGEVLAYLARGFSRAGLIVLVNQRFKETTFDVTMQRFAQSRADLNITDADLSRQALWTGQVETDPYNPWHWPILRTTADRWATAADSLELDQPLLEGLGLQWELLASKQQDLLSSVEGREELGRPEEITFAHLVEGTELGLDMKDQQPSDDLRRRIAASVVARWLRQYVWVSQNVFVDLPHAVARYPQLLHDPDEPSAWRAAADKSSRWEDVIDAGVVATLEPSMDWTPVPTVRADRLRDTAARIGSPSWAGTVFCEDTSRFVAEQDARPVVTDVPGPYQQRWIERVSGVRYDPPRRLLG